MPKPRVAKASSSSSSSSAKCPRQGRGVGRGPSSSGGSNNAAQTILNIVATLANQTNSKTAPRDKVVAHAKLEGVLGKSTFANSLTKLRKQGLVDLSPGIISISDEGLERAQPLSQLSLCNVNGNGNGNNADYLAALKKQLKLSARASALLDELSDGRVHSKKEAAAAIGCTMNSTWANMLTPLKKLKLIRFDRETIELTDDVFPFGRPEY